MLTFLSFNHFERKIIKIVNLNLNKISLMDFMYFKCLFFIYGNLLSYLKIEIVFFSLKIDCYLMKFYPIKKKVWLLFYHHFISCLMNYYCDQ